MEVNFEGMSLSYIRKRLRLMSTKLEINEINNIWNTIKLDVVNIVKRFFLEKQYETLGSGVYDKLTDNWRRQKLQKYIDHFFVNSRDMMNSIKSRISRGDILIHTSGIYAKRYDITSKKRPVVKDNEHIIYMQVMNIFIRELNKRLKG